MSSSILDKIQYNFKDNSQYVILSKYSKYKFIFNELMKTKIPMNISKSKETNTIYFNFLIGSVFSYIIPFSIIWKITKLGLFNKIFLSFVISTACFNYLRFIYYQNLVECFINQDSQIGHEARILAKYKIPDHVNMSMINMRIEEYKKNIIKGKLNLEDEKSLLIKIISEEERKEDEFKKSLMKKLT